MSKSGSRLLLVLGLAAATAVGAACGDDAATTPLDSDAGSDASVPGLDASPRLDAGTDAATDAAPPDAGPPDLGLDARVNAAVHLGTSWYLGGSFTHVHAAPAPHLLPIDLAGNAVATCKMGTGFDGYVGTSLVVGGSLYVGGNFASYNGVPARNIAKLDKTTCAIDKTFNPAGGGFDATVNSLAVLGTSLYVGGYFTAYRGVADSAARLAKLDLTTGALDPTFSPAGAAGNGFDAAVNALAVSGTSLYVAGKFTSYRGGASTPQHIAKLDATTGVNDATFCPDGMGFSGNAEALVVAGASLYVGGSFTSTAPSARSPRTASTAGWWRSRRPERRSSSVASSRRTAASPTPHTTSRSSTPRPARSTRRSAPWARRRTASPRQEPASARS